MKIFVQKLRPNAELPLLQTKQAAGYDIHACLDSKLF
ncbi:Deoxyuridine 5'-triphosphate nucleotidohydrolase [Leptospira interrogans serovar Canicola]|nr:Deoxyuridine 5'-triphosphate nucleotidohydrolase [Leptospira interrogans serovar Canicola]OCC30774.1 Deoxyuridine 5'-triphosphate nucleotidohydrolase [Leptospira interrogans serovar Canicola]